MTKMIVDGDHMVVETKDGKLVYFNTATGQTDNVQTDGVKLPSIKPTTLSLPENVNHVRGLKDVALYLGMGELGASYISMWHRSGFIKSNSSARKNIEFLKSELDRFKTSQDGTRLIKDFHGRSLKNYKY